MQLTEQQQAFLQACNEPGSLALNAVAGSGKTTTIQLGAQQIKGMGASTSFSRSTVTELTKKMPSRFPARTIHGMGLDALKAKLGAIKIDKSGDALYQLIKTKVEAEDEAWNLISPIRDLVEKAQLHGLDPTYSRGLVPDSPESWENIAESYDIPFSPFIHAVARQSLIEITAHSLKERSITFNQMLYLPIIVPGFTFSRYKTIIADEVQDLSAIQHSIVERSLFQNGRLVCAGDPMQALFQFAGALSDSFYKMTDRFNCQLMPLTVSFRCPKAIVKAAQQYVPHIEAADSAIEGDVLFHDEIELLSIPPVILCRNNSPLVKLALSLLARGHSAEVVGRDIGKGLVSLTKRIATGKNSDSMLISDFNERLYRWAEKEIARKPTKKGAIHDKVDTLVAIGGVHKNLGQLRKHIETLFTSPDHTKKPPEFLLSTVHKAKGLEWPDVAILDEHLIGRNAVLPEEIQAESNIAYVAITRAQSTLHYITSKGIV